MTNSANMVGVMVLVAALFGIDTTAQARLAQNRLAQNSLSANLLGAQQLSTKQLAAQQLSSSRFEVNADGAGDLLATEAGREVLTYIVSCALPGDITLEATVGGTTFEFPGGLGLAPEWLDKRLHKEGQGWISACLLARVNKFVTIEAISLRGDHPALTISIDEAEQYTLEEGAFYGNLFSKKPTSIACRGKDQAAGDGGGLDLRECTEPDPNNPLFTKCGFTFAGDCADFSPGSPSPCACEEFGAGDNDELLAEHGSFYSNCHDQAGLGKWPNSKEFRQVITVFTLPD